MITVLSLGLRFGLVFGNIHNPRYRCSFVRPSLSMHCCQLLSRRGLPKTLRRVGVSIAVERRLISISHSSSPLHASKCPSSLQFRVVSAGLTIDAASKTSSHAPRCSIIRALRAMIDFLPYYRPPTDMPLVLSRRGVEFQQQQTADNDRRLKTNRKVLRRRR